MRKILLPLVLLLLLLAALGRTDRSLPAKQPIYTSGISDNEETWQVVRAIERAYDLQTAAAYSLEFSKFPTIFINDPRFPVSSGTLETIRELTRDYSITSAGYLDYKVAYYEWRRDAILHSEAIHDLAKSENRPLTAAERASLFDPQGRIAPAREESPVRQYAIKYLSVEVDGEIATAVINTGATTSELTLVIVERRWYIAAQQILSVRP
jgi:hypothetical protein